MERRGDIIIIDHLDLFEVANIVMNITIIVMLAAHMYYSNKRNANNP